MLIPKAFAQEEQLVACNGLDCTVCSLLETVSNIFYWLLWTSFAVAVLVTIIGGFIYIGARGRDDWMQLAKKSVTMSIIGFAIILVSWLAVSVSFNVMGVTEQGSWWSIDCNEGVSGISNDSPLAEVFNGMTDGGTASVVLDSDVDSGELNTLYNGMDIEDVMLFLADNDYETLAALAKGIGSPEIMYVNKNEFENYKNTVSQSIIPTAHAKFDYMRYINSNNITRKQFATLISQALFDVTGDLAQEGEKITTVVAIRPSGAKVNPEEITRNVPGPMKSKISTIRKCLKSGGSWYRYKNDCDMESSKCTRNACVASNVFRPKDGCYCPNSCVKDGKCK